MYGAVEEGESDEELGLLRKALDVDLPSDFDPNKIPQNGLFMPLKFHNLKSL